jgi:tRNA(adenine34) deaminase
VFVVYVAYAWRTIVRGGDEPFSCNFERVQNAEPDIAQGRHAVTDVKDDEWMALALTEARSAADAGDVPVGAVIVRGGDAIARAGNRTVRDQDPTAHAELLAIRAAAAAQGAWRLEDCTLYVTLEPCAMCAGAIVLARLARVVFGAWDDKAGMGGSVGDLLRHPRLNHRPQVLAGIRAAECSAVLTDFFRSRRQVVDSPSSTG